MLFHACLVIYTIKELDSYMANVSKKKKGCITVYFCIKYTLSGSLQVSDFFFPIIACHDIMKGGTPYMNISPRRAHPRMP